MLQQLTFQFKIVCDLAEICCLHQDKGTVILWMVKEKVRLADVWVLATAPELGFEPRIVLVLIDRILPPRAMPHYRLLVLFGSELQCIRNSILTGNVAPVASADFAHST